MKRKKFTVSIEGNIGCGKTTLVSYFENCPRVETLKEPVEQWTNIRGHNALDLLYRDPERWTFSFNNYAMLTRIKMHEYTPELPVKMLERSLHSTRYVFVENCLHSGCMNGLEFAVLDELYQHVVSTRNVNVDLFVYLRASPEVCYERIKMRNRKEEVGLPFEYIQQLHELHENWLIHQTHGKLSGKVLTLDASQALSAMREVYEEHRSEILFNQI